MELGVALCKRVDNECPKKEECLRFTQITGNDAFISFTNILDGNGECNWFWNNGIVPVVIETETNTNDTNTDNSNNTEVNQNA